MKDLSIFIDESGDFGKYQEYCPFYIVALVFHEQNNSINAQVENLDEFLETSNLPGHTIHSAPLIRQEQSYKSMDISLRNKLFKKLFNFTRSTNIVYKTIVVDRKMFQTQADIVNIITKELSSFTRENHNYLVNLIM